MRKPYIVGERGPELFVPNQSGNIIPNHDLAGVGGGSTNIVVNVDASGSSVEGDEEQGRELGRMISVAIQSELIKQKRPGGMLA
jgi:phage-related minor tail protein